MRPLIERFKSRKFLMALLAAVVAFVKTLYPDIPEDAVKYLLYACLGYATVEGVVDAVSVLARWLAQRKVGNTDGVPPEG